jgi:hypothetical protein
MTAQLQAQVTAPFRIAGAGQIPLAIQGDPGFYADSDIHLLLTPNVAAYVAASAGKVVLGGSKVIEVPGGTVSFTDSDSVQLPSFPTESSPKFEMLFGFDSTGNPVNVSAFYDSPAFAVRASRKFTGVIGYTAYKTTARILTYTPLIKPATVGGRTTYGVIAAYYQGAMVTHQVEPSTILKGVAPQEFYRIYSYKVVNHDGEFEMPPTYPASGAYPDRGLVIDTDGWKFERPHEIGYIDDKTGWVTVEQISVQLLEPYTGPSFYVPTKFNRVAKLDPEKYPPDVIATAYDFVKSKGLGKKT